MNIEITALEAASEGTPYSEIVARFDAVMGDFLVRGATLRRRIEDGEMFVATSASRGKRGVIKIARGSPTQVALLAAALEAYRNV